MHRSGLRLATETDRPFLRVLYGQTRSAEMALSGWSPDQCEAFLDSQFELQSRHYLTHYGDSGHQIVEVDRRPIGRLWTSDLDGDVHVVDVSLLTDWRNRGFGGGLLRETLAEARRRGMGVQLQVLIGNIGARRLYGRLGFEVLETTGVRQRMRWTPPAVS